MLPTLWGGSSHLTLFETCFPPACCLYEVCCWLHLAIGLPPGRARSGRRTGKAQSRRVLGQGVIVIVTRCRVGATGIHGSGWSVNTPRKVRFSKAHWLSSIFAGRWKYLCGASRGLEQKSKRITREGIELKFAERPPEGQSTRSHLSKVR